MGAGLVREVKAKPSMPEWRRDSDSGTAFALKLMPAGSKAILASGGGVTEPEAGTPHIEAAQTPKPAPLQPAIAGAPTTPLTLPPTTDFIGEAARRKPICSVQTQRSRRLLRPSRDRRARRSRNLSPRRTGSRAGQSCDRGKATARIQYGAPRRRSDALVGAVERARAVAALRKRAKASHRHPFDRSLTSH